jgi:hypothetical protein
MLILQLLDFMGARLSICDLCYARAIIQMSNVRASDGRLVVKESLVLILIITQ